MNFLTRNWFQHIIIVTVFLFLPRWRWHVSGQNMLVGLYDKLTFIHSRAFIGLLKNFIQSVLLFAHFIVTCEGWLQQICLCYSAKETSASIESEVNRNTLYLVCFVESFSFICGNAHATDKLLVHLKGMCILRAELLSMLRKSLIH